ncbi:HAD family hydrolase [Streptomyces lunaelactis]|uniref:HAD family hydrolase n=1 Tax=Streptomyces lunaelactis TaxID=1535768 RepID=UPI0015851C57|nr:HAD family hydrolase [Streptomyces lunaelactis]NUL07658.1 HAD family hydrolase [Streptomyces lunaelactis]
MTHPHASELRDLFAAAKCVLFDFDGPICRLFEGHPAPAVAAELRSWIARHFHEAAPVAEDSPDDPHAILSAIGHRHAGSELVGELEELLTSEELRASATARPTKDADRLIRRLSAAGFRLAMTTNNSPIAVARYLEREGLMEFFGEHVHGRMPDPRLLKPDPDCLRRALRTTGSTAGESLMIGDSVTDYRAAQELEVPFLGYAPSEAKRRRLEGAGVLDIVPSLEPLLEAVEPGLRVD